MAMSNDVKKWWDKTAKWFQQDIDMDVGVDYGIGAPTEDDLNLLGTVDGKDIVELGCGGGQCAVAFAQHGATVTGIDISEEQLAYAEDLAAEHDVDVEFIKGDVTDLHMLDDEQFDIAFNAWVFQWVDDLNASFAEAYRVLRPGGVFVFSLPHPFYKVIDPDTHTVTDSYFDTGRHAVEDEDVGMEMVTYRHTVSEIYNALNDTGFTVERMLEPGSTDPDAYEPGPWGEYTPELMSKIPSSLIFKARKEAAVS